MGWVISKALMNSLCSQEQAAESLAGAFSGGEQSAPSSLTHMPAMYWSQGRTTDAFRPSRSGMTCEPLTADRGAALLMWCLADSRARTFPPPAREPGSAESEAGFGERWHALSVKFDHASCGWKTARCLWEEDLDWSCLTLPRWGSMHDGELWERATPGLRTAGNASGFWRTPAAREPGVSAERLVPIEGGIPGGMNRHFDKHTGRMAQIGLEQQIKLRAMRAEDSQCAGGHRGTDDTLYGAICKPKDGSVDAGGQLNPTWVEWLMGWPIGWTDCAASATARFRRWWSQHGKS